jgi:biopolymer transport protein ExbD
MPKVKMPRKSTTVDMTAMCDVAFLLLTFFMLATKFKPEEPVQVKTPASISEIPLPDADIMLITIDPKGRIFFSIDNKNMRKSLIENMDEYKGLNLTQDEMNRFAIGSSVGVPLNQLKSYLNAEPEQQKLVDQQTGGIPADTSVTNENNELAAWIRTARNTNPKLRIVIKSDGATPYPEVKKVISTLAGWKIFKFNLLTSLKAVPPGTAAYDIQQGVKKEGE